MERKPVRRAENLIEIDNALETLSTTKKSERKDSMPIFYKAVGKKIGISKDEIGLSDLFDPTMREGDRRFVAIALLRLFSIEGFSFSIDKSLSVKSYALFDDVFAKDIYQYLKIKKSQQTFEKERVLRDIVPDTEGKIDEAIETSDLESFRPKIMRSFGNNLSKAILSPFLPKKLLSDQRIKALSSSLDEYRKKKESRRLKTLEKAREAQKAIQEYREEAETFGTYYARRFLVKLALRLMDLLEEDLENFDGSKPASLEIRAYGKKYPLHEKGREILLGFMVENRGPGYAFDVEVTAHCPIDNLLITEPIHHLGRLDPGSIAFKIPAKVQSTDEQFSFGNLSISWKNFDGSTSERSFEFDLLGQRSDLNWAAIELEQPYSLEPVETEDELVGREKIIKDLMRQSLARSVGSSYIFGQKRVGKTSIAKTLKSRIEADDYLLVYVEGGEYISPDSRQTVKRLGRKLCERIIGSDQRFARMLIPEFEDGAFSPIVDFLDAIISIDPRRRILFVLDEFDELPIELYRRGPFGDSFFLAMRSISGKPQFGFVLVGGEKMEFIMSCQGDALNKFRSMRVDYFDKENYWSDFVELVRRPVKSWFDISDEAITALYDQTSGNPFYTKWICSNLFVNMVDRRDSHVTPEEVDEAVRESLREIASNSFQHFWEDGIFETSGDRIEEISIRRRKILLSLAELHRKGARSDEESVVKREIISHYNTGTIISDLKHLVQRHILVEKNQEYRCKVNFFQRWLVNAGYREIMTAFSDSDTILKRKKAEEEAHVRSEEIMDLVENWGLYKGQTVSEDRVRAWLNQFGTNMNQRLMLKILQKVRFYSSARIRQKLREGHGIISRGLTLRQPPSKRKRSDIIVSYLDSPGKSGGGIYAKLYSDENGIYANNVVEKSKLEQVISESEGLNALVFVDDFIGTGNSAKDYFSELGQQHGNFLAKSGLRIFFIVICGFVDRKVEIEELLEKIKLPVNVHICDPIDELAKCFSEPSSTFPDSGELERARAIAYEHGAKIVNKNFLGYGDCQTAVVFETNCPNNNLPILWAASEDPPWRPLFERS